jgi:hypothetical protein
MLEGRHTRSHRRYRLAPVAAQLEHHEAEAAPEVKPAPASA